MTLDDPKLLLSEKSVVFHFDFLHITGTTNAPVDFQQIIYHLLIIYLTIGF